MYGDKGRLGIFYYTAANVLGSNKSKVGYFLMDDFDESFY